MRYRLTNLKYSIKYAWQRLTRGYDDDQIYNIDNWLTRELSKRLFEWVEIGINSYPADRTFEQWEAEVLKAAEGLRDYDMMWEDIEKVDERSQAGLDAMKWVADNLIHLWD